MQTRWNILPLEQKNGIKGYVTELVINISKSGDVTGNTYLAKLNQVLVAIVKNEWTSTWTNFIPDICGASMEDQGICENSLHILKLLSEEIFDFSKEEMTSQKVKTLKDKYVE